MHAPATPAIIDPELLLLAYRSGIFPMADARDDAEIFWVEPRKRAVLPLDGFHLSRSLARALRRGGFRVTCNAAFGEVLRACAAPRADSGETWISRRIEATYLALHAAGHAPSIECWRGEELLGGLYGVQFNRAFCGESMFSRAPNASKVALAWLVAALRRGGSELLDCQFITPHLASLGAVEIDQRDYLEALRAAQVSIAGDGAAEGLGEALGVDVGEALGLPAAFGALLAEAAASGESSSPGNFIAQSLTQTS